MRFAKYLLLACTALSAAPSETARSTGTAGAGAPAAADRCTASSPAVPPATTGRSGRVGGRVGANVVGPTVNGRPR